MHLMRTLGEDTLPCLCSSCSCRVDTFELLPEFAYKVNNSSISNVTERTFILWNVHPTVAILPAHGFGKASAHEIGRQNSVAQSSQLAAKQNQPTLSKEAFPDPTFVANSP